jgi:hypothetical protein
MKSKLFLLVIVLSIFISCRKEPLNLYNIKKFEGEISEWSNMTKGSWWLYKDLEKDSLLDTLYIVKVVDSLYIYKIDYFTDSTITYMYIERYFQLNFCKDSIDIINDINFSTCSDNKSLCFEYLFCSKNNNMIISPNNKLFFDNGVRDTTYFDSISYSITNKKLNIENYISLYFPLLNNEEYSNECNYYLVQDYFESIIIQDRIYQDVYLIKSKTDININGVYPQESYIYSWINQDYGIIKLLIIRDDLSKSVELVKARIRKFNQK